MKKNIVVLLLILSVSILSACGKKVTFEDARQIALQDAGKQASEVTFIKEKEEKGFTGSEYEFEFVSENERWEYEISGDGTIKTKAMELETFDLQALLPETMTAEQTQTQVQTEAPTQAQTQAQTQAPTQAQTQAQSQTQLQTEQAQISADQAKQIALTHAGMEESAVRMKKLERDYEDGKLIYEIEFEQGNTEWEYDIDAVSGDILKASKEYD